jgi:hypothetical protein
MHCITSCNTESNAPEDGQNYCPKNVELIGIINKPLLLHLVGCLFYLYFYLQYSEDMDRIFAISLIFSPIIALQ